MDDGRPDGVFLGAPASTDMLGALRSVAASAETLTPPADPHPLAAVAQALRVRGRRWVLTVPGDGVWPEAEDLAALVAAAGPRGAIASDGVTDLPALGLWPRSRAAEVAAAVREGDRASSVTASMVRVTLPWRVFVRDADSDGR